MSERLAPAPFDTKPALPHAPSEILQPLPETQLAPLSRSERLRTFLNRPFGRMTTILATAMLLASGDQPPIGAEAIELHAAKAHPIVTELGNGNISDMEVRITKQGHAATIELADWHRMTPIAAQPLLGRIQPNPTLQELAVKNEPITDELGLTGTKPNVSNPTAFAAWTEAQAQRADLLELLSIDPADSMHKAETPRQLVDLAASIVVANVDYDLNVGELGAPPDPQPNYDKPIDTTLMRGRSLQCEGFAAATVTVFNQLKSTRPQLANMYMTTQSGIQEGHVWNLVLNVEGPDRASAAFIDATANEPTYFNNDQPEVRPRFIQFAEGLHDKGIIDNDGFYRLVEQYDQVRGLDLEERKEIAHDEFYIPRSS